jgi:hypothetical protein
MPFAKEHVLSSIAGLQQEHNRRRRGQDRCFDADAGMTVECGDTLRP